MNLFQPNIPAFDGIIESFTLTQMSRKILLWGKGAKGLVLSVFKDDRVIGESFIFKSPEPLYAPLHKIVDPRRIKGAAGNIFHQNLVMIPWGLHRFTPSINDVNDQRVMFKPPKLPNFLHLCNCFNLLPF
jgi:hypothetical protein